MYGHLIKDTFGPIQYIPEIIRKNVPLVITTNLSIVYDLMDIFGMNASNVIKFQDNESYIHLDKLYTVSLKDAVNYNHGYTMKNLAKLLREKLALSNSKPERYVLTNRNATCRSLLNFDSFVTVVKMKYNKYNWEVWDDNDRVLNSIAKKWNTAKYVFAPTGSNLDNCIFMQPLTTIHAVFFDWYDNPIVANAYTMNIFLVVTIKHSCSHFNEGKCKIDVRKTINDMKVSLFISDNGYFPPHRFN